jgi:hypothetical protein
VPPLIINIQRQPADHYRLLFAYAHIFHSLTKSLLNERCCGV